jgi:uncharacterized membrane protein
MIWFYIGIVLLAAFPLVLTIWRMRRHANVKKNGIHVSGRVADIKTMRTSKGGSIDLLTVEYKDRATGRPYYGRATVTMGKYRLGDTIPVAYLSNNPSKYAITLKSGYWIILIFCIILFAFVIFAIYKIDEMTRTGNL